MRDETLEWIQKAEGDFASATREIRARKNRNEDSACFHCQQCIEKYLKAMLVEKNIQFPKTHDLGILLDLLLKSSADMEIFRDGMALLTDYAVVFRYPGESATKEQSRESYLKCIEIRASIRDKLKLS
ncbi:MAG: hypothetical protein A2X48_04405 [Lentisphaerae bacterium GWF2_49_21]|nr:MAG: hypothetical protein A2X48_04405 [Lentisphaerae bacterium GWF2_49_21]